jgi:hypothetical protein
MCVLTIIAFVKASYIHQCLFIVFPINITLNNIIFISLSHSLQHFSAGNYGHHAVVKVKCTPVQALRLCTGRMAHRGSRGIDLPFGVSAMPRPLFTPRERPSTHCTGGWVGPMAGLDKCG